MDLPSTPQKRKASVPFGFSLAKRARSVSTPVKVSAHDTGGDVVGDPEVPLVPTNPQACLGGIPEELVLQVFKDLDNDALTKACLVDRRCNRIATEWLYEHIRADDMDFNVLRTIANNVDMAKYARSLWVTPFQESMFVIPFQDIPQYSENWGQESKGRTLLTKVLRSAINIRNLVISDPMDMATERDKIAQDHGWIELFNDAVHGSADGVNTFAHLKSINITSQGGLGIRDIKSIFRLPSVEFIYLWNFVEPAAIDTWDVPESSCPAKHLELSACFLDSAVAAQMLSSMAALEHFYYDYTSTGWQPLSPQDDPKSQWAEHSWEEIGAALAKHKESLMSLRLGEWHDRELLRTVFPSGRDFGTLGSLKDFSKLTLIEVSIFGKNSVETDDEDEEEELDEESEEESGQETDESEEELEEEDEPDVTHDTKDGMRKDDADFEMFKAFPV